MTCPTCNAPIALGTQDVWLRPDGKLSHLGHDADPKPAPVDGRKVAVFWTHRDPFRFAITVDGDEVWTGPSGTKATVWAREHPDHRLVRAADVYDALRTVFGHSAGTTTRGACGKLVAEKRHRRRK